ncbi:MAG: cytochrome c1 [Gammaproteobacteria bacterium]|nr:cytochrome c1 [Gammaproteobacteria bacterium]
MHRLLLAAIIGVLAPLSFANTPGAPELLNANVDLSDQAGLQNGAKLFVNYCVSCHSASFMRYNRIAADLGIPEDKVAQSMMFTTDKIGDTMTVAMKREDAETWFGIPPPDLSVIARARGADWIYSFLQGFYIDESRPTGMNNLYLPGAAMPHVLWELQGLKQPVFHTQTDELGKDRQVISHLEQATPGLLTEVDYKKNLRDLVSFLVYLGEPAKLVRYRVGVWVLLFLSVLLVAVYLLKREYWKDVH